MALHSPISDNETAFTSNTLLDDLKAMVAELSDLDLSSVPATTSFIELGLDSLFLTQLTQSIRAAYGIKLTFRQIMGELGTFAALADYLRPHVKPAVQDVPVPASVTLPLRQHRQRRLLSRQCRPKATQRSSPSSFRR
jgi:acyl carrier protein